MLSRTNFTQHMIAKLVRDFFADALDIKNTKGYNPALSTTLRRRSKKGLGYLLKKNPRTLSSELD
jgi:hypothetical protein